MSLTQTLLLNIIANATGGGSVANLTTLLGGLSSAALAVAQAGQHVLGMSDQWAQAFNSSETAVKVFKLTLERFSIDSEQAIGVSERLASQFGLTAEEVQGSMTNLMRAGFHDMAQLEKLMQGAAASAIAFGRSAADGFERIGDAAVTGTSEALNSIGIAENLGPAYDKFAKSIGTVADNLTEQQRAQVLANLVMKATATEVEALSEIQNDFVRSQQAKDMAEKDFAKTMGSITRPAITELNNTMAASITLVADLARAYRDGEQGLTAFSAKYPALGASLRDALKWLGDFRTGAVSQLQQLQQQAAPTLDNLKAIIADALAVAKNHWENVSLPVWRAIAPVLSGVFDSVGNVLSGAVELIRGLFHAMRGLIETVLLPAWQMIWPTVEQVFKFVVNIVRAGLDNTASMFKIIGKILQGDWDGAWKAIEDAAKTALDNVQKLIAQGGGFGEAATKLGKIILNGLGAGLAGLSGIILDAISRGLQSLGQSAPAWLKPLVNEMGKAAQTAAQKSWEVADKGAANIAELMRPKEGPQWGELRGAYDQSVQGLKNLQTLMGLGGMRNGAPYGTQYGYTKADGTRWSGIHNGEDIFAPKGTRVLAPFSGMVSARWSETTGNIIEIMDAKGQKLLLGHLDGYEKEFKKKLDAAGGKLFVEAGTPIARVGNTGSMTGRGDGNAHIHMMAYLPDGKTIVDPKSVKFVPLSELPAVKAAAVQPQTPPTPTKQPPPAPPTASPQPASLAPSAADVKRAKELLAAVEKAKNAGDTLGWDKAKTKLDEWAKSAASHGRALAAVQATQSEAAIKAANTYYASAQDFQKYGNKALELHKAVQAAEQSGNQQRIADSKKALETWLGESKAKKAVLEVEVQAYNVRQSKAKTQSDLQKRLAAELRTLDEQAAARTLGRIQEENRQQLASFKGSAEQKAKLLREQADEEAAAATKIAALRRKNAEREAQSGPAQTRAARLKAAAEEERKTLLEIAGQKAEAYKQADEELRRAGAETRRLEMEASKRHLSEMQADHAAEQKAFKGNAAERAKLLKAQFEQEAALRLKIAAQERDAAKQANKGDQHEKAKNRAADDAYRGVQAAIARERAALQRGAVEDLAREREQVRALVGDYQKAAEVLGKKAEAGNLGAEDEEQYLKSLAALWEKAGKAGIKGAAEIQKAHAEAKKALGSAREINLVAQSVLAEADFSKAMQGIERYGSGLEKPKADFDELAARIIDLRDELESAGTAEAWVESLAEMQKAGMLTADELARLKAIIDDLSKAPEPQLLDNLEGRGAGNPQADDPALGALAEGEAERLLADFGERTAEDYQDLLDAVNEGMRASLSEQGKTIVEIVDALNSPNALKQLLDGAAQARELLSNLEMEADPNSLLEMSQQIADFLDSDLGQALPDSVKQALSNGVQQADEFRERLRGLAEDTIRDAATRGLDAVAPPENRFEELKESLLAMKGDLQDPQAVKGVTEALEEAYRKGELSAKQYKLLTDYANGEAEAVKRLAAVQMEARMAALEHQKALGLISETAYINAKEQLQIEQENARFQLESADLLGTAREAAEREHAERVTAIERDAQKARRDANQVAAQQTAKEALDLDLAQLENLHEQKLISEVAYIEQKKALTIKGLEQQQAAELAAVPEADTQRRAEIQRRYGQAIADVNTKAAKSVDDLRVSTKNAAEAAFASAINWAELGRQISELEGQIKRETDAVIKQNLEHQKSALAIRLYGEQAKVAAGLFIDGVGLMSGASSDLTGQWQEDMGRMVEDGVSMASEIGKALVTNDWTGVIVSGLKTVFDWFNRNKKAAEGAARAEKEYGQQFRFNKDGYGTRQVETYTTGILFWQTTHYKESVDEAAKNLALTFEGAFVSGIEGGMAAAAEKKDGSLLTKSLQTSLRDAALKGLTEAFLNSAEVAALFGPMVQKLTSAFKSRDKAQINAALSEFKAGLAGLQPQLDALTEAGASIWKALTPPEDKINKMADAIKGALQSGLDGGLKSGIKEAIKSGDFAGLGRAVRESVGSSIMDALIDQFVQSEAMKAIIGPAMKAVGEALTTDTEDDDDSAFALLDRAISKYTKAAGNFGERLSRMLSRGGLTGVGAQDGSISNMEPKSEAKGAIHSSSGGTISSSDSGDGGAVAAFQQHMATFGASVTVGMEAARLQLSAAQIQMRAAELNQQAAGMLWAGAERRRREFETV